MENIKRQLVLNKGSEKFIFRYDSGCEDELLRRRCAQFQAYAASYLPGWRTSERTERPADESKLVSDSNNKVVYDNVIYEPNFR